MSAAGAASGPPALRPRAEQLRDHLAGARWFGGKGRPFEVTDTRRLWLSEGSSGDLADARVAVELLTLAYADGGTDLYQLPLTYRPAREDDTSPVLDAPTDGSRVGTWEDPELGLVVASDALQDPGAASLWLAAFTGLADDATPGLTFHRVPEAELGPTPAVLGWAPRVLRGEQSNTSVVYGDRALLKVFRRLAPGQNPDIEVLAALTAAGAGAVAPLYGWVDTTGPDGEVVQLGILQQFLAGATDGWVLALDDLRVGTRPDSFEHQATALGAAVGGVHAALANAFPTERWGGDELARVADAMAQRLTTAREVVPELSEHADGLLALFDAVRELDHPVTAQRVHGDLHLGQTLWREDGWKVIDFEGEPAKSLDERRAPDCALRDVAGMLRSFDYAVESARRSEQAAGEEERPREWAAATSSAFLEGYRDAVGAGSPGGPTLDPVLLRAYEADKAVYEAVYEARNRPAWLPIPLAALSRLTD